MSNRVDINNVLMEIRNLRAQVAKPARVENIPNPTEIRPTTQTQEVPSFSAMLKGAVNGVNDLQKAASQTATAYERGDPNVDITRVMIAAQKSTVAMQAMTQVRNKVIQAYEDIMKMPI